MNTTSPVGPSAAIGATTPCTPAAKPPAAPASTGTTSSASDAASTKNDTVYASPTVNVDARTGLEITVFRNTETGEMLSQFPAKLVVDGYARHAAADAPPAKGSDQQAQAGATDPSSSTQG